MQQDRERALPRYPSRLQIGGFMQRKEVFVRTIRDEREIHQECDTWVVKEEREK